LKKNKAEREKVREVVTVRKDTKGLEADIRRLQAKGQSFSAISLVKWRLGLGLG